MHFIFDGGSLFFFTFKFSKLQRTFVTSVNQGLAVFPSGCLELFGKTVETIPRGYRLIVNSVLILIIRFTVYWHWKKKFDVKWFRIKKNNNNNLKFPCTDIKAAFVFSICDVNSCLVKGRYWILVSDTVSVNFKPKAESGGMFFSFLEACLYITWEETTAVLFYVGITEWFVKALHLSTKWDPKDLPITKSKPLGH